MLSASAYETHPESEDARAYTDRSVNEVLRPDRRWPLQDQTHAKRRKARKTLGRPMGQAKYVKGGWI